MRRWLTIVLVFLVIAAAYWAWPFFGAGRLASAAQSGDTAQVIDRVDLPALRRSLSRQIAEAYLKASGKASKLGALGRGLAGAAVTTVADPYLAELLTPDNITAMIAEGKIGSVKLGNQDIAVKQQLPNFPDLFRADVMSAVTGSYFDGIASFVIPITASANDYAVHLRLDGLTWRLSGLDLPPAIVEEMARSIQAGNQQPAP